MKNQKWKKLMITIIVVLSIVTLGVVLFIKDFIRYDKDNLFAYAIDLENENWAYAPKGLDYGMTADEVIKAERLKSYTWEVDNEILRIEKTVKDHYSEVKELDYVKRYFFDSDGELASVRHELRMGTEYEEVIRQLLFDQATIYMPEINRKTDLEGLLDPEMFPLYGPWNKVMVWEDTVYTDDFSKVQTHANSDVVLRIGRPDVTVGHNAEEWFQEDIVISLTVSRYEDRLPQEEIELLREDYPFFRIETNADFVAITMEFCMWQAETFVYGSAIGEEISYDDKGRYKYNKYTLVAIDDTENIVSVDEVISSKYNRKTMTYELAYDGLKMIVPTFKDYEDEWGFTLFGLFYVTEDGHVIAGYDEHKMSGRVSESALSGLTLEDFMRKVKK